MKKYFFCNFRATKTLQSQQTSHGRQTCLWSLGNWWILKELKRVFENFRKLKLRHYWSNIYLNDVTLHFLLLQKYDINTSFICPNLNLMTTIKNDLQDFCGLGISWSRRDGSRSVTPAPRATLSSWTRCWPTSGRSAGTTRTGWRSSGTSAGPRRMRMTVITNATENDWRRKNWRIGIVEVSRIFFLKT